MVDSTDGNVMRINPELYAYLRQENAQRRAEWRKDNNDEVFLANINKHLSQIEGPYPNQSPTYPVVLVIGPPRSGSTLLSQILAVAFKFGVINKFVARFWDAPATGIRLSEILLGPAVRSKFTSDYGVTHDITEPHEFGYFWLKWLRYQDVRIGSHDYTAVDLIGLRNVLAAMERAFGRALLFKNLIVGFHLRDLNNIVNRLKVIRIHRDRVDMAISIYKARQARYGRVDMWWSIKTTDYEEVSQLSPIGQIAKQIQAVEETIDRETQMAEKIEVCDIQYEQVCARVDETLEQLATFLGPKVSRRKSLSLPPFAVHRHFEEDLRNEFEEAFKKLTVDD